MSDFVVTVVIPTLVAGETLAECLESLSRQTLRNFNVIVVDNSGKGLVNRNTFPQVANIAFTTIEMDRNVGFGAAINAAVAASTSPYVATLNDDAIAHPDWLARLVAAMKSHPETGSCASQVRLFGEPLLDSAGMLMCADGSSKQRGHLRPPSEFSQSGAALMPSGSAALYRRKMLEETRGFDGDFFLYCEDTDLGLRSVRAGWTCQYVADAVVDHRYSHSAGRVSPLKAYYVERNRIAVAIKNFPARLLFLTPFVALVRYFWHLASLLKGQGSAAQFHQAGNGGLSLAWFVVKAHFAAVAQFPILWRKRLQIASSARISDASFLAQLRQFSISARRVAEL